MIDAEKYSDIELVEAFLNNQNREKIFRIIMKRYGTRIYTHIRTFLVTHEEADDIVQNTFVKAWRALPKFRLESSLFTWLYKISTNETLSFLKSKQNKKTISIDDDENFVQIPSIENDDHHTSDEITQKLTKAIEQLPEKQRLVFQMKYFEEMKYEDMSEILNTSVGALKASYHFAVKKIENYLELD
ncbi:MAG: sigma-70 family RNA polymerase sigma factor [Bacteroidales bacterium]|nr:sigma-70 family RNA polymerase sigma factor [Bacteroidales bacterium]